MSGDLREWAIPSDGWAGCGEKGGLRREGRAESPKNEKLEYAAEYIACMDKWSLANTKLVYAPFLFLGLALREREGVC